MRLVYASKESRLLVLPRTSCFNNFALLVPVSERAKLSALPRLLLRIGLLVGYAFMDWCLIKLISLASGVVLLLKYFNVFRLFLFSSFVFYLFSA
jgi:hypothetical protein